MYIYLTLQRKFHILYEQASYNDTHNLSKTLEFLLNGFTFAVFTQKETNQNVKNCIMYHFIRSYRWQQKRKEKKYIVGREYGIIYWTSFGYNSQQKQQQNHVKPSKTKPIN